MEPLDRLYRDHRIQLERAYSMILSEQGWDSVVIHSGSPVLRSEFDDQSWPVRPVPHWQHWLGLVEADSFLVIRAMGPPALLRAFAHSIWETPVEPESDVFAAAFKTLWLRSDAERRHAVGGGRTAWVGETRALSRFTDAENINPAPLLASLDALRVTKSAYEVACIAEANRRARKGHDLVRQVFREGERSELDLHLDYLRATSQDDGETPYKNIVALGAHAATLHHVAYGRRATKREAESLLVDAGAMCRGYCADITRTWVKGQGDVAATYRALVEGVDALQERLCKAAQVGLPYEALHDASHREVAALLVDVGVARGSVDELVTSGVTRAFYPHGLGHSLGLQTHDVGCGLQKPRADNPFLRNTTRIEARQVFTIEPGIYFIRARLDPLMATAAAALVDWKTVAALEPLGGVRIEDDITVEDDGRIRNLTRPELPTGGGQA